MTVPVIMVVVLVVVVVMMIMIMIINDSEKYIRFILLLTDRHGKELTQTQVMGQWLPLSSVADQQIDGTLFHR